MRRREFTALLGGAAMTSSIAAQTQPFGRLSLGRHLRQAKLIAPRLPTKAIRVLAIGVACVAVFFGLRSFYLGVSLSRPLPFFDQWVFVYGTYYPYLDGKLSITDLFAQH